MRLMHLMRLGQILTVHPEWRRGAAKKAAEEMVAEQAHQEFHLSPLVPL